MRLQELNSHGKFSIQKSTSTPSLSLLQRFQRLLIGKIYSRDSNCVLAAESLLKKYLYQLSNHVTDTLNLAYEVASLGQKNFVGVMQILKGDIVGKLFSIPIL